MTGHLLSGLALTYANTGSDAALTRGRYLVSQLAALQARATHQLHPGYLSAFPEGFLGKSWKMACRSGRRIT